jgi:hypothetical protein
VAVIAIQTIDLDGEGADYAAAVGPDTFVNDGRTFLHVKNTNAATRDVTIDSTKLCDQGFDHNQVVTIPATTGDVMIGPFPTARFGTTVTVTYSAVTNLTVAAFKLSA